MLSASQCTVSMPGCSLLRPPLCGVVRRVTTNYMTETDRIFCSNAPRDDYHLGSYWKANISFARRKHSVCVCLGLTRSSSDTSFRYISDIGASYLKPLFVVGSVITGLGFFLTILAERILRERGRLLPNFRRRGAVLGVISCIFALIAAAGLSLLAGFDTLRHSSLHRLFL